LLAVNNEPNKITEQDEFYQGISAQKELGRDL
jgi:hypothetical protein